jgi:hypothetical protein
MMKLLHQTHKIANKDFQSTTTNFRMPYDKAKDMNISKLLGKNTVISYANGRINYHNV